MSGPHLVLLMPSSGGGWQLRVYFRRTMASRSRCHTSWFRDRVDACASLRVVAR